MCQLGPVSTANRGADPSSPWAAGHPALDDEMLHKELLKVHWLLGNHVNHGPKFVLLLGNLCKTGAMVASHAPELVALAEVKLFKAFLSSSKAKSLPKLTAGFSLERHFWRGNGHSDTEKIERPEVYDVFCFSSVVVSLWG